MTEWGWMTTAKFYLGTKEIKGKLHNDKIVHMFGRIKQSGIKNDETPWCAAFVGNCLEENSIPSTRSTMALSYRGYGLPLAEPIYGAIAYMNRKNKAGKVVGGHVAFVAGVRTDGAIMLLGGNQGDMVSIAPFPKSRIMGYRWPLGVALPTRVELPRYRNDGKKMSTNEA